VPKRLDPYYQANITRKNLVILWEEKQQNDSRNIITIIILLLLFLFSPLFVPEPLELEIPAKYLDNKPKTLDLPDLMEPKLNTPRFLGRIIY
jgi:hypothetical protein